MGWSPFHSACCGGYLPFVSLLFQRGIDVNLMDKYGWRPLHHAAFNSRKEIIRLLLTSSSLDINALDKVRTAPHSYFSRSHLKLSSFPSSPGLLCIKQLNKVTWSVWSYWRSRDNWIRIFRTMYAYFPFTDEGESSFTPSLSVFRTGIRHSTWPASSKEWKPSRCCFLRLAQSTWTCGIKYRVHLCAPYCSLSHRLSRRDVLRKRSWH